MSRTHVFAYGSNLDPMRMKKRVPSAQVMGLSRLHGFQLRFHKRGWRDGTGKANALPTGNAAHLVHGVIYQLDEMDLGDLDVHETGYERRLLDFELETTVEGGTLPGWLPAWIYVASQDMIEEGVLPVRWYVRHVIRGAKAHGLPGTLVEWLESHPTLD